LSKTTIYYSTKHDQLHGSNPLKKTTWIKHHQYHNIKPYIIHLKITYTILFLVITKYVYTIQNLIFSNMTLM